MGRRRTHGIPGGGQETAQTLNAILVEMDGFETNEQVIVIGATNRPDVLDPALRRPGRFDREVMVHLPDIKEREAILKVHAKKIKLAPAVDMSTSRAARRGSAGPTWRRSSTRPPSAPPSSASSPSSRTTSRSARDKVRWGRAKRSRAMDEHDRRITAYHEAGHVLIVDPPGARRRAAAQGQHHPARHDAGRHDVPAGEGPVHRARRKCLGEIKVAFAGRIAEEMFFGDISAGASNDIRQATYLARRMVCDWGMSERLGPIRYAPHEESTPWGGETWAPRNTATPPPTRSTRKSSSSSTAPTTRPRTSWTGTATAIQQVAEALLKCEVMSADEVRHEIADIPLTKPDAAGTTPAA